MPRIIYKELRENMSSFKTKTIALIASSLIVAVAGLSFATTPAFAKHKKNEGKHGSPFHRIAAKKGEHIPFRDGKAAASKAPAKKQN